ncbi:MAG: hypothetical protein ACREQ9_07260 [Candidatus Binatia bacterium]
MKTQGNFTLGLLLVASAISSAPARADTARIPVTFGVTNHNDSKFPCPVDGKSYTLTGHIVAPADVLDDPSPALTIYLHGAVLGEALYSFPLPGYDFSEALADRGHASLVINRIGYGAGEVPNGFDVCIGSDAATVHQVIARLRSPSPGDPWPAFGKIAVGGLSAGGPVAEVLAYSYPGDVEALFLHEWADDAVAPLVLDDNAPGLDIAAAKLGATCAQGGEPKHDGAPAGYSYLARDDPFIFFHDPEPEMLAKLAELQERDPCGTEGTVPPAMAIDPSYLGEVTIPVLLVYGEHGFFERPAGHMQAARFGGSSDVTVAYVPDAGHALLLEKLPVRERFWNLQSAWLAARGF